MEPRITNQVPEVTLMVRGWCPASCLPLDRLWHDHGVSQPDVEQKTHAGSRTCPAGDLWVRRALPGLVSRCLLCGYLIHVPMLAHRVSLLHQQN